MSQAVLTSSPATTVTKKDVLGVTLGAGIEFFDFSAYAIFAVAIGKAFFPFHSGVMSLLLSVSAFGIGFIFRPLGAILFGAYADRKGRKPAMMICMFLMVLGTAGFVILPDYATIGLAAPVLMVIMRMIQGLAWGGEAGPATTFIMEAARPQHRGLYTSWQIVSQGGAGILAGLIGFVVIKLLPAEQVGMWGWRIPFVVGLILLPITLYLRRRLHDTLKPQEHSDEKSEGSLLKHVFREHWQLIIIGILMISGSTITQYFLNYMATYALNDLHYPASIAMFSAILIGIGVMVFSLIGGLLADRYGRKIIIILPKILLIIFLLPGLSLINRAHDIMVYYLVISIFTALQCISGSGLVVALCENFPKSIRATGFSIAYTFGITLFGGTAQIIFSWLVDITGNPVSPGYYLVVTNVLCIIATFFIKEMRPRATDNLS